MDYCNFNFFVDPIDCSTDPCLLSWLIKDNRFLLNYVANGQCSNGTKLTDLNPFAYNKCPASC